jgi:YD repeat-containing protein
VIDIGAALIAALVAFLLLRPVSSPIRRGVRHLGPYRSRTALLIAGTALMSVMATVVWSPVVTPTPQAQAQSGGVVLLPRGSVWAYTPGSGYPVAYGSAPFTLSPCAGDGTAWSQGEWHREVGNLFTIQGPPQNVKARIRFAGGDADNGARIIMTLNGVSVFDTGAVPSGQCDSYWNYEVSIDSSYVKNGANEVGFLMNNGSPHKAFDAEIIADDVGDPNENASFGQDLSFPKLLSADPVNTLTGNFTYQRSDVVIPGRGGGVSFSRSYNSLDTRTSTLGPGWGHAYNTHLETSAETGWPTGTARIVQWDGRTDRYTPVSGGYSGPPGRFDKLEKFDPAQGDGTVWLLTHQDYSKLRFNASGLLIAAEDRNGNTTTLTYDGSGRLSSVADPAGRGSLTFGYDGSNRIISVTDWASPARTVQYGYDSSGRLWKVWDHENNLTTFEYETGTSRLTKIVDANGHTAVEHSYDSSGRVSWQKDARGNQTDFTYATGKTTQTLPTTSYGSSFRPTIEHFFDGQSRLAKITTTPASGESTTA